MVKMDKITEEIGKVLGYIEDDGKRNTESRHEVSATTAESVGGNRGTVNTINNSTNNSKVFPSIIFNTFIRWQIDTNTKQVKVITAYTTLAKSTSKIKTYKKKKAKMKSIEITDEEVY